jgi:hypothetical protein
MVSLDDVVGLRAQFHRVAPLHFLPRSQGCGHDSG